MTNGLAAHRADTSKMNGCGVGFHSGTELVIPNSESVKLLADETVQDKERMN